MGLDFGVAMISCCYLQAGYVGEDVESILITMDCKNFNRMRLLKCSVESKVDAKDEEPKENVKF
jgi:hypothetical protein